MRRGGLWGPRSGHSEEKKGRTYAKHLSEVRIPEPEGDVGDMQPLGLGLVFRVFRRLCLGLAIRGRRVICLLKEQEQSKEALSDLNVPSSVLFIKKNKYIYRPIVALVLCSFPLYNCTK